MWNNNNVGKYLPNRCLRTLFILNIMVFCIYLYYSLNTRSWAWYLHTQQEACRLPASEMQDLVELARDTNAILNLHGLVNVLIYGSLFGALRYKNPLPWDNDFDILVRQEELEAIDEKDLIEHFRKKDIEIHYRHWMGAYRVTRSTARGDIMLFKNYSGVMKRVGIEAYVFFVNYNTYHNFPARLLEPPLPANEFCGVNFSVPNNRIEIQKYHYPDDWWLERKPKSCYDV